MVNLQRLRPFTVNITRLLKADSPAECLSYPSDQSFKAQHPQDFKLTQPKISSIKLSNSSESTSFSKILKSKVPEIKC